MAWTVRWSAQKLCVSVITGEILIIIKIYIAPNPIICPKAIITDHSQDFLPDDAQANMRTAASMGKNDTAWWLECGIPLTCFAQITLGHPWGLRHSLPRM